LTDIPRQVDVLVAGAGPAGSATAALLARSGCSVLAVDRATFPRDKACSEYMSPETVRILTRLRVMDALEKAGGVGLRGLRVSGPAGAAAHGEFARAAHPPFRPTGFAISRRILDSELVAGARAAGAVIAEGTCVEELLYDQGSVSGAVLRDRSGARHSVLARLTVGADGLRSLVARRIGRRTYGRPRRMAFVAHVAGVREMGLSAELHVGHTGYVGLNPIDPAFTNVGLVVGADRVGSARGKLERFFLDTLEEFPSVAERLRGCRIVRPVLATGPFAAWSRRVVAPGAVLVGDAADFFDPFTGDGIHSALRGAELIEEALTPALHTPDISLRHALGEYRRARSREFRAKWMLERLITWSMSFPRLFERGVTRIGRRAGMADTMIGVAGGFVPARDVLNPIFLARMVV
jgi:menaquinone-9 beta-reductase